MKLKLIVPLLLLTLLLTAQRDPQWLMPLYFTDANGDRDTVYFGYDPEANNHSEIADIFLGENWIVIDTTKFNIYLWSYPNNAGGTFYLNTDTVRKVDIRCAYIGTYIGFCKGKLPIVMKWVDSLMYSESCPYPDLSPRPRARIDLTCSHYEPAYYSCNPVDGPPLSLTDYPAPEIPYPVLDSMVFNGSGLYPPSDVILYTDLRLVRHDHVYGEGLEVPGTRTIRVFPNPFAEELTIEYLYEGPLQITIISVTGEVLLSGFSGDRQLTMDVSDIEKGFYLIRIQSGSQAFIQKIVKPE